MPIGARAYPILSRWGTNWSVRHDLANVHVHRVHLNTLSWEEVYLHKKIKLINISILNVLPHILLFCQVVQHPWRSSGDWSVAMV